MKKQDKENVVQEARSRYGKATMTVLVKNSGLTVAEMTDFRKKLRAADIDAKVIKNTLSKLAVQETDYMSLKNYFTGPAVTLWAYGDPAIPAKVLSGFLKDQQKAEFIAGSIGTKVFNFAELNKLATLPSRKELLGKLLGSFKSPATGFVNVLAGVPRNFLNVLNAIRDKKTN